MVARATDSSSKEKGNEMEKNNKEVTFFLLCNTNRKESRKFEQLEAQRRI